MVGSGSKLGLQEARWLVSRSDFLDPDWLACWSDTAKNGLWFWGKILGRICRRDLEGPKQPTLGLFHCPKHTTDAQFGKYEGLWKLLYVQFLVRINLEASFKAKKYFFWGRMIAAAGLIIEGICNFAISYRVTIFSLNLSLVPRKLILP